MLTYLDASGNLHEIFISPGRYAKAAELLDAEDWDALPSFPAGAISHLLAVDSQTA
jgi:hypothetical protein